MRGIALLCTALAAACGSVKHQGEIDGGGGGDFGLAVAPASALLRQGQSIDLEVTIDRQGFDGDIEVTAGGLPDGVSGQALTIADGEETGTLTLEATAGAVHGEAAVTVTGEAPNGTAAGDLRLLVGGEPGSLDESFAEGGTLFGTLGFDLFAQRGITLQPDGKIVGTGSTGDQAIAYRLNPDGSMDDGFGVEGRVTTGIGPSTGGLVPLVLPDGRIVVAGWGGDCPGECTYDSALFGYTATGELDGDFGSSGTVSVSLDASWDEFHGFVQDAEGGLLAAATGGGGTASLRRYDDRGDLDDGYTVTPAATANVEAAILDSDGKTVMAGSSAGDFWLERHLDTGALDTGFDADGAVTTDFAGGTDQGLGVVEIAGGKLVVGGLSGGRVALARYNRNGSLDLTFGDGGKVVTTIELGARGLNALAVDSQGRYVLVGFVAGPPRLPAVVRLTADGEPDETFGEAGLVTLDFGVAEPGAATSAFGIAIDADDRIIAGCNVASSGEKAGIARLWP